MAISGGGGGCQTLRVVPLAITLRWVCLTIQNPREFDLFG